MRGRTYRYLAKEPLYPFGFGLSYTRFRYSALTVSAQAVVAGEGVDVGAIVENIGERSGDEVVQLYVKSLGSSCVAPHHDLRGFDRVTLAPGESQRVAFHLTARDLSLVDDRGRRRVEPGRFRVTVGGSQPDARSVQLLGVAPLAAEIDVVGGPIDIR
jgi:beta-glucosidase